MLRILTPWDSQPQEPTDIDPRWVDRGLKLAFVGQRHLWANGSWRPNGQTSAPAYTPGPSGLALNPASGFVSGVPSVCTTTGMRSIVFHGFQTSNAVGRIFQDTSGDGTTEGEGFWLTSGGPFYIRSTTTGAGFRQFTTGAWTAPNNTWYSTGLTHDQSSLSNRPTQYANGTLHGVVTESTAGTGAYKTGSGTITVGNRVAADRTWPGFIRSLLIFDSLLTAEEHKELADNPNAIFAPRSIWVPVSVGGGGASTITAAAGASTASTLTASSTAASTPTAAAGAATASTVAASSTAASAITSATGAATASTLTGSAVVAGAITAAAGVGTGGTLVGTTLAAGSASIVAAAGVATTATLGGSSVAAADIGVAAGVATASVMGGPGAEQATTRLFAGGFPRREQFRKGYIIKGERYWLTEEELAVMVAQMLSEVSKGDIKQVTAGKPKPISKRTWDAIRVEARIEAVSKQFDDTDEDEDESILMML